MHAALNGRDAVLQLLLARAPASATQTDSIGKTPAYFAAERGHTACLRMLLELAPATAAVPATAQGCYTPAHLASFCGHADALEVILAVDPTAATVLSADGTTPM